MNYAMGGKSLPAAAEAAAADIKAEVWPCEHAVAHAWTTCHWWLRDCQRSRFWQPPEPNLVLD